MCGIVGRWARSRAASVPPSRLEAALRSIRHRGPDDEGYAYIDTGPAVIHSFGGDDTAHSVDLPHIRGATTAGDLALANRRLAIQDRTAAGHLPMRRDDLGLCVAYNGEIYNFQALRTELEAEGRVFSTSGDTEVLLHAYDAWGLQCLERFNGMWAFALWDGRRRSLVIARDRYGVKPLYLRWDGLALSFASEIKALLALESRRPRPNDAIVGDYLALGLVDHRPETFFEGIVPLEPGHVIDWSLEEAAPTAREWYHLPTAETPLGDSASTFAQLFENAVSLRLIADVPVGTCLSGGLDSSSVVVEVDRLLERGSRRAGTSEQQLTFSARYDDPAHDEGRFIDAVVAATRVEAHSVYPSGTSLHEDLAALIASQGEPFGSTSIYAQYCVFRLARGAGCVVTLDGQGGDETAGGYLHYFGPMIARLVRAGRLGRAIREAKAIGRLHPELRRSLPLRTGAALLPWRARQRLAERARTPAWSTNGEMSPSGLRRAMPRDPLRAQIYRDVTIGLRHLLRVADHNSMAHSVESRLPFLDVGLLETFYAAPADAKLRDGVTKVSMRRGLADLLPQAVLDRHDKVGFSTPEETWFRTSLRGVIEDTLGSQSFRSRAWKRDDAVEATWRRFLAGDNEPTREVWRWLNLELWYRAYVD